MQTSCYDEAIYTSFFVGYVENQPHNCNVNLLISSQENLVTSYTIPVSLSKPSTVKQIPLKM